MKGELTAIIETAPEDGFWAICPEVQGANGQGETVEETKNSLKEAVALILKDRLEDIKRGLPDDAIQEPIVVTDEIRQAKAKMGERPHPATEGFRAA